MAQEVIQQIRTVKTGSVIDSSQKEYKTKKVIFRSYQIIWYILGVIEALFAFRVMLKLLGANAFSGFASFIYAISGPFALPFAGILGTTVSASSVFEWSTLIAMVVYFIVAYGIISFFSISKTN